MDLSVTDEQAETTPTRPWHKYLLLAGLALLLLWLGLKTWRISRAGLALLEQQQQAETLLAGGWQSVDPQQAETLLLDLRANVLTLQRETALFMPLAPRLGWVPRLGPTLAAAPHLMEMADSGTEAAVLLVQALKPAFVVIQDDQRNGSPLPEIVTVLDQTRPELVQAALAMERVAAARDAIQHEEALPRQVQTLLAQFDQRRTLAVNGLKFAAVLPTILGADAPQTYLLLAQNEDELRATGGFISGVGVLRVDQGEIVSLDFVDANFIGDIREKPFDYPPQPLHELMGLDYFLFRDANFWPDFPTSAEHALTLYSYSEDFPDLDGAIALNQRFIPLLLQATGPVEVAELGIRLNHNNAIQHLRDSWSAEEGETTRDWVLSRKDFLAYMAGALHERLETGLGEIDLLYLADTLETALAQKQLMLYVRDPAVAATLDEINWDGRLEHETGQDTLAIVDSNVGYNKANPLVESTILYDVTLQADGTAQAALNLTYTHRGPADTAPCVQGRDEVYGAAGSYEQLMEGCYFNYLRVYAPAGIQLLEASRHHAPPRAFYNQRGWDRPAALINELPALATIENFFTLPPAGQLETAYQYTLPSVVTTQNGLRHYRLTLYKQAGAPPTALTVRVTLPAGATFHSATPAPAGITAQAVTFVTSLETDMIFTVTFQ